MTSNERLLSRLWKGDKRYKRPRHLISVKAQTVREHVILSIEAVYFSKDGSISLAKTAYELNDLQEPLYEFENLKTPS